MFGCLLFLFLSPYSVCILSYVLLRLGLTVVACCSISRFLVACCCLLYWVAVRVACCTKSLLWLLIVPYCIKFCFGLLVVAYCIKSCFRLLVACCIKSLFVLPLVAYCTKSLFALVVVAYCTKSLLCLLVIQNQSSRWLLFLVVWIPKVFFPKNIMFLNKAVIRAEDRKLMTISYLFYIHVYIQYNITFTKNVFIYTCHVFVCLFITILYLWKTINIWIRWTN